ncbi:hypothetical protein Tco_1568070 [Tanacetum coccineum]
MEKGEGEEDINSILNNFTSKMSHIMNRDGNEKEDQVPHEAGVTSATSTHVENPKQNEQSGWEDANIQAMKNTIGNPKSSFINVVSAEKKNPKINFRVLFNKEHVEDSDFMLPVESVEIAHNRFANSLVIKDDDDVYYFKFTSTTGLEHVLEKGPWMIRNQPLILTKWAPNLELAKDVVTKVPVWVKIHKVPVVAYSEDGLSLIASQIRKPVLLDAFTSAMCNEPWGCIGYARALIEVLSDKDLKKEIIMEVPLLDETPEGNDGFTMVRNRRNKGKKVATDNSRHIDGLKLSKPNPKFVRNVKSNLHTNKKPNAKNDEVDSIKIKNNFSILQDDDTVFATQEVPETSTKNDDTYVHVSPDSESEVEEMENEFNVKNDTNKGASTPSDDILNV